MAKKKVKPLLIGAIAVGGIFLINKIVKAKGEGAIPAITTASSKTVIPPNRRWRVILKSGEQTEMNSALLQNAIEAKGVKSYSEITTKQA